MADYNLRNVLDALKEADKSGNTEDAKRLAMIADRLSKSPQQEKEASPLSYMAKGVATAAGSPVDIVSTGLELIGLGSKGPPIGGSKNIENIFRATGMEIPEKPPETAGQFAASGIGEVLTWLIPSTLAVKSIAKGTGIAATISKSIINSMSKHPAVTLTAEITGGAGMGLGRKVGKENPQWGIVPELVGGIAGGVSPQALSYNPGMLAARGAKKIIGKLSLPFSEAGAKYRAGDFLKKQVSDPALAAAGATEKSIGGLPPVVMTNEKRLMGLYNQIKNLDPVIDAKAIEQISKSTYKLEQEMRGLGQETPKILKDITEKRIASIELNMDNRIAKTMELAQRKIDALPVAQRQSQESIIVRNELNKVMTAENESVKKLWNAVPKKTIIGVKNTKTAYENIVIDLPTAQRGDIPAILHNKKIVKDILQGMSTTVNEMQGLRSKLLETARFARANNQWNKARIADEIADGILADMEGATGNEPLVAAIAATKNFKQRFEQGTVGKILGHDRTSAPTIAPELTLDIATSGKGVVDINKVVITPEAKAATEKYLARSFTDYALDKDIVNPIKAGKWIKNNEEILDSFPNLKTQLEDIKQAQKLAIDTKAVMEARKAALRDPRISVAGQFLKTDIGDEIKGILKSSNPVYATKQLVQQARKDVTGGALEGLKGGFIDHILESSSTGGFNAIGEKTLSGKAILGFLNNNRDVVRQIFPQEQILKIIKIGEELAKIETLESTKGLKIEYGDAVSNMLKFASRFAGAAAGRHWAKAVGAGGTVQIPGFFADNWHRITTLLTKNRFERLVHDAIISPDGKLLETLLLPINKPGNAKQAKEVIKKINAWLGASGNQVLEDIINEGETPPSGVNPSEVNLQKLKGQSTTGGRFEIPERAEGGEVKKGKPYIVGEEGKEVFVPKQDGVIIPNKATAPELPELPENLDSILVNVKGKRKQSGKEFKYTITAKEALENPDYQSQRKDILNQIKQYETKMGNQ